MATIYAIDLDPATGAFITHYTAPVGEPVAPHTERLLAADYAAEDVTEPCMVDVASDRTVLVPIPAGRDEQGNTLEELQPRLERDLQTVPGVRVLSYGVAKAAQRRAAQIIAADEARLADRKAAMLAQLAYRRWQIEVGGFDFRGKRVMSDRDSQAKIQGLVAGISRAGDDFNTAWKCYGGQWLHLDRAGAEELVDTAIVHISTLFSREAHLSDFINEATTQARLDELQVMVDGFV